MLKRRPPFSPVSSQAYRDTEFIPQTFWSIIWLGKLGDRERTRSCHSQLVSRHLEKGTLKFEMFTFSVLLLRLRTSSLSSCSIWNTLSHSHHRFSSEETKILLSHHQHQLPSKNLFPYVPVGRGHSSGEQKRVAGDQVHSCICSMHSSCWSSCRG